MVERLDVERLVADAAAGDERAWAGLVEAFSGVVWAVARTCGLTTADASDVSQTTWLRLAENLHTIRQPASVGAWLATTARREAFSVARRSSRVLPSGDDVLTDVDSPGADAVLLGQVRATELWRAFRRLPEACRALLRMLLTDPPTSYADVSTTLQMPVGSIGPRRSRCLDQLRCAPELVDMEV